MIDQKDQQELNTEIASSFDPASFMQQTVDGPIATQILRVAPGEYVAMIGEIDEKSFRQVKWTDKNDGTERAAVSMTIPFLIEDDKVKAAMGRDRVFVGGDQMLDFDSRGGISTDPGKNVLIGQTRAALGQNDEAGWTPARLSNQGPVVVKVVHQKNDKDPENPYVRVSKVTKLR